MKRSSDVAYKLIYTERASRDIAGLGTDIKKRIGKALLRFQEDPFHYAEPLIDSGLGTYRFRIGDYRVVFDLDDKEIIILRVGHRKDDIPKKLKESRIDG